MATKEKQNEIKQELKNKKKILEKLSKLTDEEKYQRAKRLTKATQCLVQEKEKAKMFREIALIYESLGDYEDAEKLREQCLEEEKKHQQLAKEQDEIAAAATPVTTEEDTGGGRRSIIGSIVFFGLIVIALAGIIYLKTYSGRYTRAAFFESTGNYEKSYKMFKNLKTYKDSESRYQQSLYEYAEQCTTAKKYPKALTAYRTLEDYQDSTQKLADLEITLIQNAQIGDDVFFGNYHWLVADKDGQQVLLVKSLPINGFAYNNTDEDVTWETCSLRTYLNHTFFEETFSDANAASIIDTEVVIPDNTKYKTSGGNATVDKVFLFTAEQFTKYQDILSNHLLDYWLVAPGCTQNTAQFVSHGEVMDYGYQVTNTNIHIRPAVWVDTGK